MKNENTADLSEGGLTKWCVGIVVQDKEFGVDVIKAWPSEKATMVTGDVFEFIKEQNVSYTDINGDSKSDSATYRAWIEASWFADSTPHLWTSPMVRSGESVQLYRYKDTGKIYWTTMYREPRLRKIERFVMGASNIGVGEEASANMNSIYAMDVNTLDKELTLFTTVSNGEAYSYKVSLLPRENRIVLEDNVGNSIEILSSENKITLTEVGGGIYESKNGQVTITAPQGMIIKAQSLTVEGPTEFKDPVEFKSGIDVSGGKASIGGSLNVGGSANFAGGHGPHY